MVYIDFLSLYIVTLLRRINLLIACVKLLLFLYCWINFSYFLIIYCHLFSVCHELYLVLVKKHIFQKEYCLLSLLIHYILIPHREIKDL